MDIDVMLTAELFKRFTLFDTFKRRKMWRSPAIFAAILCTCGCVCLIMRHVDGAVLLGSVLLIIGLGFPLSYFSNFSRSLQQQINAHGLTSPKKVYSLHLSKKAEGICVFNEQEKVDYKWANVYHVYRDKDATYLYMNAQRGFILPHNCIPDGPDKLWKLLRKTTDAAEFKSISAEIFHTLPLK